MIYMDAESYRQCARDLIAGKGYWATDTPEVQKEVLKIWLAEAARQDPSYSN